MRALYHEGMQQVVAIHGGDSFATYEEFWKGLYDKVLHLDRLRLIDWKSHLKEDLGPGYDVLLPRMPNPQNARYAEWKLWFEKMLPQLDNGVILVGHSMGGVFLAKYLSENRIPVNVKATLMVAPPFDTDYGRPIVEFSITNDLAGLAEQGGKLFLYQSEDDPTVDYAEHAKYARLLPELVLRTFPDRGHFIQDHFPELVEDIRTLAEPVDNVHP